MRKKLIAVVLAAVLAFGLLPAVALAAADEGWYTPEGGASSGAPYLIADADDLAGLASLVNTGNDFSGKFLKIADAAVMDLSGYLSWTPIGTPAHPFKGTLDGNGISISHLTINDTYTFTTAGTRCIGLFGDIGAGGTVKNIALSAPDIAVTDTTADGYSNKYTFVGCIAGVNEGTVSNCTITDGVLDVSGIDVMPGGVAGANGSNSGTSADVAGVIEDCSASVTITATNCYQIIQAGGIAGISSKAGGQITGCSSTGAITAIGTPSGGTNYNCSANIGGLVGYADGTAISDSTSSCSVTAEVGLRDVYAGGLIGNIVRSTVSNCNSSGDVSGKGGENTAYYGMVSVGGFAGLFSNGSQMTNCYSTGDAAAQVKSIGLKGYAFAGGFVGYVKSFGSATTISQCFSTGDATAVATDNGYGFSGGLTGYLQSTAVGRCFSSGDASGSASTGGYASAGGLAGYVNNASVSQAYAMGGATADCVTKERAAGLAGALSGTNAFTECYSAGLPAIAHSGSTLFACGAFLGAADGSNTLTRCYYDNTVAGSLSSIGVEIAAATGAATGISSDNMTTDGVLSAGMADLSAGGYWIKRTNTDSERYYPELSVFGTASGAVLAASKASVTISRTLYAITVVSGSGSGSYAAGSVIDITADTAPSGKAFDKWTTSGGGSFGDANSASTTFTVPAQAVTVTAVYKSAGGSGNSGGPQQPPITVVETPSGMTGNVTVTPVGDAFDRSVEVRLTEDQVTQEQVETVLSNSGITHGTALVYPVDISLYIRGTDTRVQPKEGTSVRITCPIPQELMAYKDKLAVVCIVNGELSVLQANVVKKGGVYYVEFEASHFSPYAFVVDETGALRAGLTIPVEEVVNPPKTGDNATLVGVMTLVFALGAALVLRKKT